MPPHPNLLAAVLGCLLVPNLAGAATLYDEIVDPEISDDNLNPTAMTLGVGSCDIAGTISSLNGVDREYITLTVPASTELTRIDLVRYETTPNEDQSFIGFAAGSTLPDVGTITASNLDGAMLFGAPDIGANLLDSMNGNLGSAGYTTPLGAGNYTFWIQETGAFDVQYMFSLTVAAVPEPSTLGLIGIACLGLLRRRR